MRKEGFPLILVVQNTVNLKNPFFHRLLTARNTTKRCALQTIYALILQVAAADCQNNQEIRGQLPGERI
jgi:hypothetical protein